MNYYRCPTCYSTFSEVELTTFKCSENYVGPEIAELCPKCLRKRKGQRFSRLEKIETEQSFSMDAPECRACIFYKDCSSKRRALCAYLSTSSQASIEPTAPISQPVAVEHDFREIKCGDMTYAIDLEKVKRELEKKFEQVLESGC